MKNLRIIINHFDKYSLLTQKLSDYHLFKQSVHLIENKSHLTMEGLLKLVSIKASLNWGLSDKFKKSFPNIIPIIRPEVKFTEIQDINWFVGFVEGEGCFMVVVQNAKNNRHDISLKFTVTQHNRDLVLFNYLINYFGCGKCYLSRNEVTFVISKFSEISNKIIPLFNKYPLLGTKQEDYLDFLKVADLIRSKNHLTKEGVEKIQIIKCNMNSKRIHS